MKKKNSSDRAVPGKRPARGVAKLRLTKKTDSGRLRVGIFGGNFDPFHNGHLNSLETVAKELRLAKIRVIPAFQSPLRTPVQGSTPEQRLEMVQMGLADSDRFIVDDREIRRGGVSYTITTLSDLKKAAPRENFYLIIGMDQFENFDQWKDFSSILSMADLVVTSRPGMTLPASAEELPGGVKPLVKKFSRRRCLLTSGHNIHFVQLNDIEVSATEIRKRLRDGFSVTGLVPEPVADYIKANRLYEKVSRTIGDFERFTNQCAELLLKKGAVNVQAYDLRSINGPAEYTLIASGTSTRHASALGEFLSREVKNQLGVWPQGVEGVSEGRWVVIDYGSLIIHIFYDFLRQEYRLEDLWKAGRQMSAPSAP